MSNLSDSRFRALICLTLNDFSAVSISVSLFLVIKLLRKVNRKLIKNLNP